MTKRKLLMIVPYQARDLEGHALVGHYLRTRFDCDVVYSNGYRIEKKLLELCPDALVMDHLVWNFKASQARLAKSLGMKVLVLPTEGLLWNKEEAVQLTGTAHGVAGMLDLYLSWGHFQREAILESGVMADDKIKTVGCPRFDFYSDRYSVLSEPKEEFLHRWGITNPNTPVILWATNTTYTARSRKKIFNRYVTRSDWKEDQVNGFLEDHWTQFREHSQVVLELAQRRPDWNFIIKIHPAEWINSYVPLTKKASNIHLAYGAPIRDFLRHCDVLLQRNCTTATEAWMLGKPVLQLEVGTYNLRSRQEYLNGNHIVRNIAEAEHAISEYLAGAAINAEQQTARDSFISDLYYRIDGRSSERCAELIDQVLSPPNYTSEDRERRKKLSADALEQYRKSEDARLPNRIKDLVGISRDTPLRMWKKFLNREAKPNLGLFENEAEVQSAKINELYRRFSAITSSTAGSHSVL